MLRMRVATIAVLLCGGLAGSARADMFRDIGYGLLYAGFNIEGDRNYASGGADFLINRQLLGNTIDFGPSDLTVAGPVSLSASYGGRFLSTFDVSFRTALDRWSEAEPLTYVLNSDVGNQTAQISGSLYVDANLSVNELGFYDIDLTYSSRQDANTRGRFANENEDNDFDVGPINISGNVFADALALLTAPLFDATGTVNVFSEFSGAYSLASLAQDDISETLRQLAEGTALSDSSMIVPDSAKLASLLAAEQGSGNSDAAPSRFADTVVPEPAVLVLLLAGAPFVFRRRSAR